MRSQMDGAKIRPAGHKSINLSGLPLDLLGVGLDMFNLGIALYDRHLRYEAINATLAEMHNLPQGAHIGKKSQDVMGSFANSVASNIDRVFSTGNALPDVRMVGRMSRRPDVGCWLAYFFPLNDDRRRVIRVGVLVQELNLCPQLRIPFDPDLSPPAMKFSSRHVRPVRSIKPYQAVAPESSRKLAVLSLREEEVLRLLAVGRSSRQVSSILGISIKTVEAHRSRLMLKIHAPSLVHLVHYAIRHKIIDFPV